MSRPKKYCNNAEKQKAYRERQKRLRPAPACFENALRNSRSNVTKRFNVIDSWFNGMSGRYVVTLECGHKISADARRDRKTGAKGAPKTCYCWKC